LEIYPFSGNFKANHKSSVHPLIVPINLNIRERLLFISYAEKTQQVTLTKINNWPAQRKADINIISKSVAQPKRDRT